MSESITNKEQQLLRAIRNCGEYGMVVTLHVDKGCCEQLVERGLIEEFRKQALFGPEGATMRPVYKLSDKGAGLLHLAEAKVSEVSSYVTVPEGVYKVRIAEVRPGTTRAGDERWSLRLVVSEGEYAGKMAAWDSIVFSTRGHARARMVFLAFGAVPANFPTFGPGDLEGLEAWAEIRPARYETPNGHIVERNEVPYDGYRDQEFTL